MPTADGARSSVGSAGEPGAWSVGLRSQPTPVLSLLHPDPGLLSERSTDSGSQLSNTADLEDRSAERSRTPGRKRRAAAKRRLLGFPPP